mmetsp:Transcript_42341/g.76834  ORF Transcript_42341/g.76834 Transcript_42341/m.76834 type:complete len:237 (-) Transcript_42341:787-1497(-)
MRYQSQRCHETRPSDVGDQTDKQEKPEAMLETRLHHQWWEAFRPRRSMLRHPRELPQPSLLQLQGLQTNRWRHCHQRHSILALCQDPSCVAKQKSWRTLPLRIGLRSEQSSEKAASPFPEDSRQPHWQPALRWAQLGRPAKHHLKLSLRGLPLGLAVDQERLPCGLRRFRWVTSWCLSQHQGKLCQTPQPAARQARPSQVPQHHHPQYPLLLRRALVSPAPKSTQPHTTCLRPSLQ